MTTHHRILLGLALPIALGACAANTSDSSDSISKDQARELAGKGDFSFDWCEYLGWYGDGVCDEFCVNPDPDCEAQGECRTTGCGGSVCAEEDMFTTCEAVPGQECLQFAICERQGSGDCGFTATPAYDECMDSLNAPDTWLSRMPTQCRTNPWETEPVAGDVAHLPDPELNAIVNYYASVGIAIDEIGLLNRNEPMGLCAACQCPRGDTLVVRASGESVAKLKALGFQPTDLMGHETIQCGGNPWEALADGSENGRLEGWTLELGARATVGFVHRIEPFAVCAACSCPRGDVAVAVPVDHASALVLEAADFDYRLPLN